LSAKRVVVTDYPDADLIANLSHNIATCASSKPLVAKPYLWGADASTLIDQVKPEEGFDVLILADLLFNHSEHAKLVDSVRQTLKPDGSALVFFTPYRPWLLHKDLAFFDLAKEKGFIVEKVLEKVMDKVMFEQDPGVRTPS
jgi:nicotinamide N-methyltransferase